MTDVRRAPTSAAGDGRRVLLVVNPRSRAAREAAGSVARALVDHGTEVLVTDEDLEAMAAHEDVGLGLTGTPCSEADAATLGADVVVVLGGDGTILRAAELARPAGLPLFGVNLGHVGFLAEAEPEDLSAVVEAIQERQWVVEERLALDIRVVAEGEVIHATWALNEVAVEKGTRARMIEVLVEVDGRPLSRWGCDGVVCATPTGSTAYAFSAGGPVVWPEVQALLVVPLSAHALFARPLVVSPTSVVALELSAWSSAVLSADGRRIVDLPADARVEVRQHPQPVRFARLSTAPFTDRLVAKFELPVDGWRGRRGAAS
jgi:NAD+ kinase